jgi:hypothetical protein
VRGAGRMIRPSADTTERAMPNIPFASSPEQPPLAPHDPPEPAPQAAAWRRALRVIGHIPPKEFRMGRSAVVKTTFRKG